MNMTEEQKREMNAYLKKVSKQTIISCWVIALVYESILLMFLDDVFQKDTIIIMSLAFLCVNYILINGYLKPILYKRKVD